MSRRDNGVYYTPPELAEYLAAPILRGQRKSRLLDPAYGEGSLLLAAERVWERKKVKEKLSLYGCDIKPVNGLLTHLPQANLKKINFFDFALKNKFGAILMNPPFVRHHRLSEQKIEQFRTEFPDLDILDNSADLWAYFIMKSALHLKEGGSIGAILPWAFLQADYAQSLRDWLTHRFKSIRVLALNSKFFEEAQERVVLVWLNGYGTRCDSIQIGAVKRLENEATYTKVLGTNWISNKVVFKNGSEIEHLLRRFKSEYGFSTFEDHADVKIGVVTGANSHFVITKEMAKNFGFRYQNLLPIITSTKEFPDVLANGKKNLKRLVKLNKGSDYNHFRRFISQGIKKEFNLRAHSLQRTPWYSVKTGEIPDGFFPYRISQIPYLIFNHERIQSTNSVHRIYFKNLSEIEMRWIHVSLLTSISQLSLEIASKTYGRGMLKIEPRSLKSTLVLVRNDKSINQVYHRILACLKTGNKNMAMTLATEFIDNEIRVPKSLSKHVRQKLKEIHSMRLH